MKTLVYNENNRTKKKKIRRKEIRFRAKALSIGKDGREKREMYSPTERKKSLKRHMASGSLHRDANNVQDMIMTTIGVFKG